MRLCLRLALATSLSLFGSQSITHAAQPATGNQGHFGWMLSGAAEFGGDEVARVYYVNNTDQAVKAGQGLSFGVGGHYRFANSGFDLGATVGMKYVTTKASNVDIHINRTVFEILGSYIFQNDMWVSAGPVMHQDIKLDAGGLAPNVGFDDASGITVKVGWKYVGLTYTDMEYQDTGRFRNKYDASSFGLFLIGRF